MDAADPLRAARPEDGPEKPKGAESQDDGYESNSGEARRPEPEPQPAEPPAPPPPPLLPPQPPQPPQPPPPQQQPQQPQPQPQPQQEQYEPLMRHYQSPYRQFDQDEQYQHFPFPKYSNDPYNFKREPDAPYDMSHHPQHYQKRDEDMYNGVKRECDDPYSFVEEEAMSMMLNAQHSGHHAPPHEHHMMHQQMMLNQPKKRGRKKKIKDENGMEIKAEPGMEVAVPRPVKERKKHDRFNGMSEEEVARRTLPDHLTDNLDIIIIGINPGLFAAYKGHHYAGPGNHFWKCLYLSGLTREQMSADEDYKLLNFGIGFTNMVPRPTKGSADLTRREIKEGSAVLLEKLQTFRPKVAVFNGKLIYEVFSGKKDFCFGKQPDTIAGTNTYMWVMPSSSARCAQLPRAADKVPFYAALKKFRDYLNGLVAHVDDSELVFPDNTARRPHEEMEIRRLTMEPEPGDTIILEDGTEVPLKKKRGRPKKVKLENGEVVPPAPRAPRQPRAPPALGPNGEEPPKKKRGRPKKIRPEEQQYLLQQQQEANTEKKKVAPEEQQYLLQQQVDANQSNVQLQQQQQQCGSSMPLSHEHHQHEYMSQMQFPHETPRPAPFPAMEQPAPLYDPDNYYQTQGGGSMENSGSMDMSGMGMSRAYLSPAGGAGAGGYGSPRGGVYHSPRSQPYSPTPPPHPHRHQPTPQPQFPSSPGGVGGVGVGVGTAGVGYGRGLGSSRAARSPLYASSPAPLQPSPAPLHARYHEREREHTQYSRSPAPAGGAGGSSGAGGASASAASPAGALHSYTPSPQHTPYSQHSSPQPAAAPQYSDAHYTQGGSTGSAGSGSFGAELSSDIGAAISSPPAASPPLAVDFEPPRDSPLGSTHPGSNSNSSLSDFNKTNSQAGSEMSPLGVGNVGVGNVGGVGGGFGGSLYEGEYPLHAHSPNIDHYRDRGNGGVDSPRLDAMHQHPNMYPNNFNRSPVDGGGGGGGGGGGEGFRPPDPPHTPHQHHPGSPASYGETKTKSQDVASKSLSGLESLVDQIPSIAEGGAGGVAGGCAGVGGGGEVTPPAPAPALPEYAPALYPPYSAYPAHHYPNNGYGGPFVGYGGGYVGGLMRPTPGYLSEWQYGYAGGVAPVPAPYGYNGPYYNGYTPPPAHSAQTHYLSAPPLLELHKNSEHAPPAVPSVPSVGFGGFC